MLFQHEEGSVQMFEYLLEKNGLRTMVVQSFPDLKDKALEFIKELIKGEDNPMRNKKYLYQVYVYDFYMKFLFVLFLYLMNLQEMILHRK